MTAVPSPRGPDWPALSELLAAVPLPAALPALERRCAPWLVDVDVWMWDIRRHSARSLRTGATATTFEPTDDGRASRAVTRPVVHLGDEFAMLTASIGTDSPGSGPAPSRGEVESMMATLADLCAGALRSHEGVVDLLTIARRREEMSLPAEMQWSLLPPPTFIADRVRLWAAVEPAYETGGDLYDYAYDDGRLQVAVIDAMGHGLRAAATSALAIGALRRARRAGRSLPDVAMAVHVALGALQSSPETAEFVCALLMDVDVETGRVAWISCGHLPPLVLADGTVRELLLEPSLPLGMTIGSDGPLPAVQEFVLEPGERLAVYSDGMTDNAGTDGSRLGDDRFRAALADVCFAGDAPTPHLARRVVERLLTLTGPELRDDATIVVLDRLASDPRSRGPVA